MQTDNTIDVLIEKETDSADEEEPLDNPDLYFGEKAIDNFWDFYKSDRKFKDYTDQTSNI